MNNFYNIEEYNSKINIVFDFKLQGIYLYLKKLYPILFQRIFQNKNISIITIQPQDNNYVLTLPNNEKNKIAGKKILTSFVKANDQDAFEHIAWELDFELGNMFICEDADTPVNEITKMILEWKNNNSIGAPSIRDIICFGEADGYILNIVNSSLNISEVKSIIESNNFSH
jgi:hypothetical protein